MRYGRAASSRIESRGVGRVLWWTPVVFAALLGLSLILLPASASTAQSSPRSQAGDNQPGNSDWPAYLFGPGHSSYNASATAITPTNAPDLAKMWRWQVPPSPNHGSTELFASPTVVGGVAYIGAMDGYFYAISETTHQALWSDFLGVLVNPPLICGGGTSGIISTATVAKDPATGLLRVYVFSPDGYLYALDAASGAVVWKGHVDTPNPPTADYYSWGSPLVANGNVYIGSSADCGTPVVSAGVFGFNQTTGTEFASWRSLVPGVRGASVWSSVGAAADGSILATTGNSCDKCTAHEPLYDESIVRLDPNTLQLLDAWQIPSNAQTFDGDFAGSPTTFTASINGVSTPMVGACDKNGIYYAFEQGNLGAGPVWQYRMSVAYTNGTAYECNAAAIWNGTDLIEGGGAPTTIGGINYTGSVQALDPSTGNPIWQTGLPGTIVGSPTEDGAGVVAAQTYQADNKHTGVYLLDAATGGVIGFIATPKSNLFGQAVFAGSDLLIGAGPTLGLTDYEVVLPPTLDMSTTVVLATGVRRSVTFTGHDFVTGATIKVSGPSTSVAVSQVTVTPTAVKATVSVAADDPTGAYTVTVTNPNGVSSSCSTCFAVVAAPTLTAVDPSTVAPGSVTQITLTGSGFALGFRLVGPSGVTFSGASLKSSTTITAVMTVSASAPSGSNLPITVSNRTAASGYGSGTGDLLNIVAP
jgi:outer membrane protein assembly factor BamB